MTTVITTTEALAALPLHAVLVDRLGLAYQVVQQGSDTSFAKSGADTRRNGFAQVGGFTIYTAEQMASALPVRVVDDGEPETGTVAYKAVPSTPPAPEETPDA